MSYKSATKLNIPRGTRLHTVWRAVLHDGTIQWQVWTGIDDVNAPFGKALGTYMQLNDDGSVTRVTERHNDVDIWEIIPAYGDKS